MKLMNSCAVKIWILFPLLLNILFISLPSQAAEPFIRAQQKICTVPEGSNRCSSLIEWQADTIPGQRNCVFNKESKRRFSCNTDGKADYIYVPSNKSVTLELRRGGLSYENSVLLDSVDLIGLDPSANTEKPEYVAVKKDYFKRFSTSFSTASWDGKLHFKFKSLGGGKRGLTVRSFRHKSLREKTNGGLNFEEGTLFSDAIAIDRDSTIKLNTGLSPHLAVFPHSSRKNNPTRSDALGASNPDGSYLAYRFYGIVAAREFGESSRSEYCVTPPDPDKPSGPENPGPNDEPPCKLRHILGKFQAVVVVENPDSKNSRIVTARILSDATALRDQNNGYLYGYEPTTSLDGNLLIYSGNPIDTRIGNGGMVMYSYSRNHFSNGNWSVPQNIVDMYSTYGPGRSGGEYMINGIPFSQHYPIARYPLRDYRGVTVSAPVFGAYPWLSFDASEVFVGSKPGFYGPSRHATLMMGARTHGTQVHVDGDMNFSRGNPTEYYSHWLSTDQGTVLNAAYRSLKRPGFSDERTLGGGFEQVLLSPMGMFGTSWDPYALEQDKPLPLSNSQTVYGFIASSGSKYAEIELPDHYDDLVLYYPMNEPLLTDYDYINAYVNNGDNGYTAVESNEENRRRFKYYVENETADYSKYLHVGRFIGYNQNTPENSTVSYPFEFHDTKNVWADKWQNEIVPLLPPPLAEDATAAEERARSSQLKQIGADAVDSLHDIQNGVYGNSIYFKKGGFIRTSIKPEAFEKIHSKQEFTFSFWVNRGSPSTSSPSLNAVSQILKLDKVFLLWITRDDFRLRLYTTSSPTTGDLSNVVVPVENAWNHYAASYKRGLLKLYVNGEVVFSKIVRGSIGGVANFDNGVNLYLGPSSSLSGVDQIQMDETYIYSTALDENEIKKLAWLKKQSTANSHIDVPAHFDGLSQEIVSLDSQRDSNIRVLGRDLFHSTDLSRGGNISCASCHSPGISFSDSQAFSIGTNGQATRRNSQPLINLLFGEKFTFNGRAGSLEEQTLHPIIDENEMGFHANSNEGSGPAELLERLNSSPYWLGKFDTAFGEEANFTNLSKSIARYMRGLITDEVTVNNQLIQKGKEIFNNAANCVACHKGPNLTDGKFHNIGLNDEALDTGRAGVSRRESDIGAFKTPSLYNLISTEPYFHDGSASSLAEVIEHYNKGGNRTPNQSSFVRPLKLNEGQIGALKAYLESLSGRTVLER